MANINLVTFLDNAQRTIIGEQIENESRGEFVTIKNPVVVNIVPQYNPTTNQPTGQMALQLLPVYFREFQGDKSKPSIFKYPANQITMIEFDGGFDFRLYGQYEHIFNATSPTQSQTPNQEEMAPVIKLFEE